MSYDPEVIREIYDKGDDTGLLRANGIVRNNSNTLARQNVRAPFTCESLFSKAVV